MVFGVESTTNSDLGIDETKKKNASNFDINGGLKVKLPSVDMSSEDNKEETTDKKEEESNNDNSSGGDGIDLGINLPDVNLPDVNLDLGVDVSSVDVKAPEIDLTPVTDLTDKIIKPVIDTGNAIADSTMQAANDLYETTEMFVSPIIETTHDVLEETGETIYDAGNAILSPVEQAVNPTLNTAKDAYETVASPIEQSIAPITNVAKEFADTVGKQVQPISEFVKNASEETISAINNAVNPIADELGQDAKYILDSSNVVEGDGSGYAQLAIGDTGYSVDASKIVDDAYNGITQGTALEGVSGKDVFSLVSDPKEYINNQSENVIQETLVNNIGMDAGIASDIIQATKDPSKFIEEKGKDTAINLVSKSTGIDKNIVGAGLDLLDSKDLNQAVQKAADMTLKHAATEATHAVLNSIPVIGNAISAIARIFQYSCHLATASYVNGYLTNEEYLRFTHYRLDFQSNEILSDQTWIGYQTLTKKIRNLEIKNKLFGAFIHHLITKHWLGYINAKYENRNPNILQKLVVNGLRWSSIATYYLFHKKSVNLKNELEANLINISCNIIKFMSSCRKKELSYGTR